MTGDESVMSPWTRVNLTTLVVGAVMVMVIHLGLNRSLPRYLCGNSGSVRRERRRASNTGTPARWGRRGVVLSDVKIAQGQTLVHDAYVPTEPTAAHWPRCGSKS